MKSLFRLPNLLLLAIAIFAFAACTEDPEFKIPPSVDLLAETGFLSGDATLVGGSPIRVKISAAQGDNPMKSLEFQQDGVRMSDATRITIDGATASSTAELLFDGEKDAFTKEIEITPHADGFADYTFIVSDDGGESSSVTISITIESNPPSLTAPNAIVDLVTTPNGLTSMSIKAEGVDLTTLGILEGGTLAVGTDRFFLGGVMPTDGFEGELTLDAADQAGFTKDLFFRANDTDGTIDFYTVVLTDAAGLTATLDVSIEAKNQGTALTKSITGALLNAGGPMGTGGLDLDEGIDTGSNDPIAEIKDQGIDISQPDVSNWRQRIAPTNAAQLKSISAANFPDGLTFADVTTKEVILSAWDAGTSITQSEVVAIGDVFVVFNTDMTLGDRYFLIEVSDITITPDDNEDQYTFNIKW